MACYEQETKQLQELLGSAPRASVEAHQLKVSGVKRRAHARPAIIDSRLFLTPEGQCYTFTTAEANAKEAQKKTNPTQQRHKARKIPELSKDPRDGPRFSRHQIKGARTWQEVKFLSKCQLL